MPTYDYRCRQCAYEFEAQQPMTATPLTDCPECNGPVNRLIGKNIGIRFVGAGFYVNDSVKAPT